MRVAFTSPQREAWHSRAPELLVEHAPGEGASYLLRVMLVLRAVASQGASIALVASDSSSLESDHLSGPGSLWETIRPFAKLFKAGQGGTHSLGSSKIHLIPWDRAQSTKADIWLIDGLASVSATEYADLRARAMASPPPADGGPRIVVASSNPPAWARQRWAELGPDARVELPTGSLPEPYRSERPRPEPPAPISYREWLSSVLPALPWYRHMEVMAEYLQAVAEGELSRLMIFAPPRHYKSLMTSRGLPGYALYRDPSMPIALGCSTEPLALELSADARAFYRQAGGQVRDDSASKKTWKVAGDIGVVSARGVSGQWLGIEYRIGIIDDPFTKWEAAASPTIQKAVYSWYRNTWYNRRQLSGPWSAAIILMHQRLTEGDLAGRLLAEEGEGHGDGWTVLNLPAIAAQRKVALPETVRLAPDWREEGEPLCPELQTLEELEALRAKDEINFSAIYQQDPYPDSGGDLFKREDFQVWGDGLEIYESQVPEIWTDPVRFPTAMARVRHLWEVEALPKMSQLVRGWDFAASAGQGDWTVGMLGGRTEDGRIIWLDLVAEQIGAAGVKAFIAEIARQDGTSVEVRIPQEPGAAGKIFTHDVLSAVRDLGSVITSESITGSKRVRATPHAGAVKAGRVWVLGSAPWAPRFLEEHHRFSGQFEGERDDVVDAAAEAFAALDVPISNAPPFLGYSRDFD